MPTSARSDARAHEAVGWKVNGAGGEGGSMTILCGPSDTARRELRALPAANPRFRPVPINLSRDGLRVWESAV